jgi:hypothetical protein
MSVDESGDYWAHASNGIYFRRIDDHETLNPLCIVDDPLEVGKAWADTVYVGSDYTGVDYIYKFECVAEEELVLPAGTFHTFEIRYEIYTRIGDFWTLSWVERKSHCEGVGLVRLILEDSPWGDGEWELTSIFIPEPVGVTTPTSPHVGIGSYPNPFNPWTTITFALDREEWATVGVYDLTGRRVDVLADGLLDSGPHALTWNGRDSQGQAMPSGTYLVRLESDSGVEARKITLIR